MGDLENAMKAYALVARVEEHAQRGAGANAAAIDPKLGTWFGLMHEVIREERRGNAASSTGG